MDATRFDSLARALSGSSAGNRSRRSVLSLVGGGLVAALAPAMVSEAQNRKKHKGHKHKGGGGGGELGLREICDPAASTPTETCQAGLECDSPTTRHQCSSTVEGIDTWCCVPPGDPALIRATAAATTTATSATPIQTAPASRIRKVRAS